MTFVIRTITDTINEHLESLSQWFLQYIFDDETINSGGSAFKFIFDKFVENIFSFKALLLVFGVYFLVTIIRLLISLIRGKLWRYLEKYYPLLSVAFSGVFL